MTQPTIKEKIEKLTDDDNRDYAYFVGPDAKLRPNPEFLKDFIRLICEEIKNNFDAPEDGVTRRIVELTEREILKALE